ncbi:MAG: PIN domain-containing protein [Geminicoccaceae bacterium]
MSEASVGLDTNVLVYTVDSQNAEKCRRAQELVRLTVATARGLVALQTVGEFYAAVTRRGLQSRDAAAQQARDWLRLFPVVEARFVDVDDALASAAAGRTSYWDGMLLATLRRAGCVALLTEDMQDGAVHAGVTIRNPFAGDRLPAEIDALLG